MTHSSKLFLDEALKVYRGFEEIKELLNVGGGMGTSLGNIISMYPHIHGKNFDLPNVISVALKLSGLTFSSFLFLYFFGNVYLLHIPYITYMPLLHKICDKRRDSFQKNMLGTLLTSALSFKKQKKHVCLPSLATTQAQRWYFYKGPVKKPKFVFKNTTLLCVCRNVLYVLYL